LQLTSKAELKMVEQTVNNALKTQFESFQEVENVSAVESRSRNFE